MFMKAPVFFFSFRFSFDGQSQYTMLAIGNNQRVKQSSYISKLRVESLSPAAATALSDTLKEICRTLFRGSSGSPDPEPLQGEPLRSSSASCILVPHDCVAFGHVLLTLAPVTQTLVYSEAQKQFLFIKKEKKKKKSRPKLLALPQQCIVSTFTHNFVLGCWAWRWLISNYNKVAYII